MADPRSHPMPVTLALCATAAAAFVAAFPPVGVWPIVCLAPALLTIAARYAGSTRSVLLWTSAAFIPAWMILHIWLLNMSAIGWPILALYLTTQPVLFVWIIRRMGARFPGIPMTLLVPVVWTGVEFFRGSVFMHGYPWYLLGQPLIDFAAMAQAADLFGVYGETFLAAVAGGILAEIYFLRSGASTKRLVASCAGGAAVLAASSVYGAFRLKEEVPDRREVGVLIMQTNLPQSNKQRWEPEQQKEHVFRFAQETVDAAAIIRAREGEIDLIVWPETMVPGHGLEPQALAFLEENNFFPGRRWFDLLSQVRRMTDNTPLIVGSPARIGLGLQGEGDERRFTWDASHNSAYLIDRDDLPFQRYDKTHLTPFGETMPYISQWPWLEEKLLLLAPPGMKFDLDAAEDARRLEVQLDGGMFVVGTPICYEDTVPRVCRMLVFGEGGKADALINLSNDGWFGWSAAGREHHAQFARFRCIENRVPMIRAANTGISMHIDSSGKVIDRTSDGRNQPVEVCDRLHATLRTDERVPLYARIGNLLPLACLAAAVGGLMAAFVPGRKDDN